MVYVNALSYCIVKKLHQIRNVFSSATEVYSVYSAQFFKKTA